MEIGSEFWITEDHRKSAVTGDIRERLEALGQVTYTSSGRGALSLLLQQIQPARRKVLLPFYICDSVIRTFQDNGYDLAFYGIDQKLESEVIDPEVEDIGVFLFMGYFGFPTGAALDPAVQTMRERSVIVINDMTHSMFTDLETEPFCHYRIGSLRKWYGTPSGGFLISAEASFKEPASRADDFIRLRTAALVKKGRYMMSRNPALKNTFLSDFSAAEELLDSDPSVYRMDELSRHLMDQVDVPALVQQRRQNYAALETRLNQSDHLDVIFHQPGEGVCPMFFPVRVRGDRQRFRSYLTGQGIYCPIHWPVPDQIKDSVDGTTRSVFDTILSIPCDQRYDTEDMDRIGQIIDGYQGGLNK